MFKPNQTKPTKYQEQRGYTTFAPPPCLPPPLPSRGTVAVIRQEGSNMTSAAAKARKMQPKVETPGCGSQKSRPLQAGGLPFAWGCLGRREADHLGKCSSMRPTPRIGARLGVLPRPPVAMGRKGTLFCSFQGKPSKNQGWPSRAAPDERHNLRRRARRHVWGTLLHENPGTRLW